MTFHPWTRNQHGSWELHVEAEEIPQALIALSAALLDTANRECSGPPAIVLQKALAMLENFPDDYVGMVAESFFSTDALLEYEDDILSRGSLTTEFVHGLDSQNLERLSEELQSKIRLTRIEIEFRPDSCPFSDGQFVRDCGNVIDPLCREWLVSITSNCIEGWFDAAA